MTAIPIIQLPFMRHPKFPFHMKIHRLMQGFHCHRHDYFECLFVMDGRGKQWVNGEPHTLGPGVCSFILPYQTHEIETEPGSCLVLYNMNFWLDVLAFPSDPVVHRFLTIADEQGPVYMDFTGTDARKMQTLMADLLEEYESDSPFSRDVIALKLQEMLIRLYRHQAGSGQSIMKSNRSHEGEGMYVSSIWRILQYMHAHFREELSLAFLAKHFHISTTYLSGQIKERLGISFSALLHDIRIRHACGLLLTTDMKVYEIAMECGFGTYNTFSRVFRQQKKMTPAEFREAKELPSKSTSEA